MNLADVTKADLLALEGRLTKLIDQLSDALTRRLDVLNGSVAKNSADNARQDLELVSLKSYNLTQEKVKDAVTAALKDERAQRKSDLGVDEERGALVAVRDLSRQYGNLVLIVLALVYIVARLLGVPLPAP